jgi:hypothetical protein
MPPNIVHAATDEVKNEVEKVLGDRSGNEVGLSNLSNNAACASGENSRVRRYRTLSSIPAEDIFHKGAITAKNNKSNRGSSESVSILISSDVQPQNPSFRRGIHRFGQRGRGGGSKRSGHPGQEYERLTSCLEEQASFVS